ncbi:hypothetical protein ILUMI_13602 [Ignelater luminosus]|uniref:Peptidase aspartic putative domain-containing protein n=1 Tax=Ignelater luminosus TaxID=2038154 RepID=A0A8K0D0F5_IGNLU|nr:hypothetical protein ILUMI_13602 [Ignelater luminosus]
MSENKENKELKQLIRQRGSLKARLTLFKSYVEDLKQMETDNDIVDECRTCKAKHHTLLHINKNEDTADVTVQGTPLESMQSVALSAHTSYNGKPNSQVLLSTAIVNVIDNRRNVHKCRVILDSASESNIITREMCDLLGLEKSRIELGIVGINQEIIKATYRANVEIHSRFNSYTTTISCIVLPKISDNIPEIEIDRSNLSIPTNIRAGLFWSLSCTGQIQLGNEQSLLHKTKLGWIISGPILSQFIPKAINCNLSREALLHKQLSQFWKLEKPPTASKDAYAKAMVIDILQPASSPYNISEKVKEANTALFSEEVNFEEKESKVKFKEDLVDYEPELSYDDTTSIESEDNIDYSLMEQDTTILESQLQTALILNVCNTDEEEEEIGEIIEEIPEEITPTLIESNINFSVQCESTTHKQVSELKTEIEQSNQQNKCNELNKSNKTKFSKKMHKVEDISCKRHCIDSIDRFDFNANISVSKINLREKPYQCPRLKLQRRNCCEKNEIKAQQKLPSYTGLRSEYGLNAAQLEKRERIREILKLREQERQRILEENKRRKIQQNEQIFCEWLKSVSIRKNQQKKNDRTRQPLSSTVNITFPTKPPEAVKQRPKTANEILPKHTIKKKRPHTSSTCIFIEVPPSVLQKGIHIGDLLVTKSSKMATKKTTCSCGYLKIKGL